MSTTPVFSEVIDVGFDTKAFETSVSQMVEIWKQGLEQMSGSDVASSGATSVDTSGISAAITSITADLGTLRTSILESFGSLGVAAAQASQQAATSATDAATQVDEAWKTSSRDQLDELAKVASGSEEAYAAFITAADAALQKGASIGSQTLQTQRMVFDFIQNSGVEAFDELTARQQQWYTGFAQIMAGAENKAREFTDVLVVDFNEAWDQAIADNQRWYAEQAVVVDEASNLFTQAQQKQVAMYNQAQQQMLTEFRKRAENEASTESEEAATFDRSMQKQVQLYNQAQQEMVAEFRKREEQTQEQNRQSQSFGGRVLTGLSEQAAELPEMLANLATMQVLWAGIGAIMSAAYAVLNGIVGAFKSGFEYATQLEEAAANLQGVIAANVKLSADMPTNFKLAGDAAKQIAMDFEDAGIKYGMAAEVITRGFKSFVDNGGASLTTSLKESEQVAILFAAALKGAGKDAEATRSMLSEIPKLLDGTAASTSKILETLNLTVPQWNAILAASKQHHDLLQQLTPILQPYVQVADQAGQRQQSLIDTAELWGKRLMAVVDQSIWDQFKGALQDVQGFFEAHKASLEAIAGTLGDALGTVVKLVVHVIEWVVQSKAIQAALFLVVGALQLIIESTDLALKSAIALGDFWTKFMNILENPSNWKNVSSMWAQIKDAGVASWTDIETQGKASLDRMVEYATNKAPQLANPLDQQIQGGKTPADHTKGSSQAFKDLKSDYDVASKEITEQETKIRHQADLDAAARIISIQQAADIKKKADQDEYDRQIQLIALYRQKADAVAATSKTKPGQVDSFDNTLDKRQEQFKQTYDNQTYQSDLKSTQDRVKLQDQYWKDIEASTTKGAQAELQVLQTAAKSKEMLASDAADKEIGVVQAEHDILQITYMQELTAAGANETAKATVLQKMAVEDTAYTTKVQDLSNLRNAALLKESEATKLAYTESLKAQAEADAQKVNSSKKVGDGAFQAAEKQVTAAQSMAKWRTSVVEATEAEIDFAKSLGMSGDQLDALDKKLSDAKGAQSTAQKNLDTANQKQLDSSPIASDISSITGDLQTVFSDWGKSSKEFTTDFSGTIRDFASGITTFQTSVGNIVTAIDKGGVLGGAGAAASTAGGILQSGIIGQFTKAFSSAPVIGGLLSAAGALFTSISGLFTQKAQDIANQIQKQFSATMQSYQDGALTLSQTISQVEKERTDAISQLSGQKGGQSQLDKLLPQLDQQIAQLKLQQTQLITTFQQSLTDLQFHSGVLGTINDQWVTINKTVKDYLAAGGDANKAAQYLSESLAAIKENAYTQLETGEQTAINDALQLNSLLQQRIDLQKQEAASEFSIVNADALERRGSAAIIAGTQLQLQKSQYQTQLDSLNQQITLTQSKVDMEKQIFDIATNTAALQKESNQIVLDQLAKQLQDLKDYQSVYNDITVGSNGLDSLNPSLLSGGDTANTSIGQITINMPPGTSPSDGQLVGDTLMKTLQTRSRYGLNPSPKRVTLN